MPEDDLQLLRGTLDVLVLKALQFGPQHGYAVAAWIHDTTAGKLEIEDGALYNSLHRMEKRGWLGSRWGLSENNRRAKYYRLTRTGRRQLARSTQTWESYAAAVFNVLGASE